MKALPPTSEPSHFMICPDCDLAVEVEELHEGSSRGARDAAQCL